jgi:transketolase
MPADTSSTSGIDQSSVKSSDKQASRKASRKECANAIRALSMDAVQKANSGHPGAPMGMADIAEVLWHDFLQHNPTNPNWINRDRFVLSNGHGSMLIYSLLHLTGYDLPMEELANFRQLHSKTPGHPEYGYTPGVETTTGPLGQGLANGVGMAIAERTLAAQFNRDGFPVIDHYTYVFVGDGCLMEGISHEVCSLAGTLGLGKLIVFYDDNGISIDGEVDAWFRDDTNQRFQAYGWQTLTVDGHNPDEITTAIKEARANTAQPTLIKCKTTIGFGSPNKAGTAATHGAPLGEDEVQATREALGWKYPPFEIPEAIYQTWEAREKGYAAETAWKELYTRYEEEYPVHAMELIRRYRGELFADFEDIADQYIAECHEATADMATRKASQNAIAAFGKVLPELIGGSADLTTSNLTAWDGSMPISEEAKGNYIYYGVREFGMAAINNGIALHGGFIPYAGTFLIFMEYARNAVRMAALMKQRSLFVFTHDSIGQGEDGPTHQAIEQLCALRVTPNMSVWRPADAVETAVSWKAALMRNTGPTSLVLTRQGVPHIVRTGEQLAGIDRGAYVLADCDGEPDVIVIATGSEVAVSLEAVKALQGEGNKVRLVSMPSTDVFDAQDEEYREAVLPSAVRKRVAVEAAQVDYWYKYVGLDGKVVGMTTFGESAPGKEVMAYFGFTVDNIKKQIAGLL